MLAAPMTERTLRRYRQLLWLVRDERVTDVLEDLIQKAECIQKRRAGPTTRVDSRWPSVLVTYRNREPFAAHSPALR
jgi:hypothetical protein